jgi:hypothetical protein
MAGSKSSAPKPAQPTRYEYQFDNSFKPMACSIEGFVSVGTGGLLNCPDACGTGQTGAPHFPLPGQATAAVPTGWQGGFSGCIGLLGAGVAGIERVSTGTYEVQLEDDWAALDSAKAQPILGAKGCTELAAHILMHTIGIGNSMATGVPTAPQFPGMNPKNTIWIQFTNSAAMPSDIPPGGGFFIDVQVRDSLAGVG